jgi:hypothetical protein
MRSFRRLMTSSLIFASVCQTSMANPDTAQTAMNAESGITPAEHLRGTEQTFLTFPEWFLVFSPAEYADYVASNTPTQFPFLGHIGQFWQSYHAAYRASNDGYPFNFGYHVMIMVIGASTTAEYSFRALYETLIGRISEATQTDGLSPEDVYGAKIADDYVKFIRARPWYEFDFWEALKGLWQKTPSTGNDMIRKWERRYALTTEYSVKAIYGWLIKKATKASYAAPISYTATLLDHKPKNLEVDFPGAVLIKTLPNGNALVLLHRYDLYTHEIQLLADQGNTVLEIAGNNSVILVSAITPVGASNYCSHCRLLFEQPILTQSGTKRVALVVPVGELTQALTQIKDNRYRVEHVFDY